MWNAYHSISASEEESPPNRNFHHQRREVRSLKTAFSASMPLIPKSRQADYIIESDSDDAAADIGNASQRSDRNEQCKSLKKHCYLNNIF